MNSLCHKYLNQNILPFVGRESEFDVVCSDFKAYMEEGESRYLLLQGQIGFGKTRLVEEFEAHVESNYGASVVIVHVRYLAGNAAALTPIFNSFFSAFEHHDAVRDVLKRSGLIDDSSYLVSQTRDASRLQLLIDALHEVGRRFPLVIILEDLQNATDLAALDQFLLALSNVPKYCFVTERTESGEPRSFVEQLVRDVALREERFWRQLLLAPITLPVLGHMIQTLFELTPTRKLLEATCERSGGSPLKLRTLVRQLVIDGRLCYNDETWEEDAAVESSNVQSNEGEFQKELQRLTSDETIFLSVAAFIGEQFDIRLAEHIALSVLENGTVIPDAEIDSIARVARALELLVYKSILRTSIPSIPINAPGEELLHSGHETSCYEFVHHFFWKTVRENDHFQAAAFKSLPVLLPLIASGLKIPLYTTSFVSSPVENTIFRAIAERGKAKIIGVTEGGIESVSLQDIEAFIRWAVETVRGLRMSEPAQSRKLLLDLNGLRQQIVWHLAAKISPEAFDDLLMLQCLAFEAAVRSGETLEAERELEQATALGVLVRSDAARFSPILQARFEGRVAAHRANLAMAKAETKEFQRWAKKARDVLSLLDSTDLERAILLTSLARSEADWLLAEGRFDEADKLIDGQLQDARLLMKEHFDEYGLFIRLAVMSKLKQDRNEAGSQLIAQVLDEAAARKNSLIETAFLYPAATAAFYSGDLVLAKQYIEQGIHNARKYGIRFTEIMCTLWRMIIAAIEEEHEIVNDASKMLDDLLSHAAGQLTRISLLEGRSSAMNYLRRHARALDLSDEAIKLAKLQEVPTFTAWALNEKGLALAGLGKFNEAISTATECLKISTDRRMLRRAYAALAIAYTGLRDDVKAEESITLGLELATPSSPDYYLLKLTEARYKRTRTKGSTRNRSAKLSIIESELKACVAELLEIAGRWKAVNVEQSLRKEFAEWVPKPLAGSAEQAVVPLYIQTFGVLTSSAGSGEDETKGRDNKVRQLIGLLIVAKAEQNPMTRETIVGQLWPDVDMAVALRSLHTCISRARQLLGDQSAIQLVSGVYEFGPHVRIDLLDMLARHEEARRLRRKRASFASAYQLERIMEISERGTFLEGIYGMPIEGIRTRVLTIKRDAAVRLIQIDLERGLFDRVEQWTSALLLEDEFDEEAIRALLMLNVRRKQTAQALSIYESYAKRYKNEFHSEPSPELRALLERVQRGERI